MVRDPRVLRDRDVRVSGVAAAGGAGGADSERAFRADVVGVDVFPGRVAGDLRGGWDGRARSQGKARRLLAYAAGERGPVADCEISRRAAGGGVLADGSAGARDGDEQDDGGHVHVAVS